MILSLFLSFISLGILFFPGFRCTYYYSCRSLSFPKLSTFAPPSPLSPIPHFPDFPFVSGFFPSRDSLFLKIFSFAEFPLPGFSPFLFLWVFSLAFFCSSFSLFWSRGFLSPNYHFSYYLFLCVWTSESIFSDFSHSWLSFFLWLLIFLVFFLFQVFLFLRILPISL